MVSTRLNKQDDNVPEDAFDENMPMSEILAAIRESIADENKDVSKIATPPASKQVASKEATSNKAATKTAASKGDNDILDLTVEVGPDDRPRADATVPQDKAPVASMQADAVAIGDDMIAMEIEDPEGDIDALLEAAEASAEASTKAESGAAGRLTVEGACAGSSAIEQLARGIASTHTPKDPDIGANDVSPIEAFVADLVRDWLDKNMPTIVEDVIARELAKKTDQ